MIYVEKHYIVIHATAQSFQAWDSLPGLYFKKKAEHHLRNLMNKLYNNKPPTLEWTSTGLQKDGFSCGYWSLLQIFLILTPCVRLKRDFCSPRKWLIEYAEKGFQMQWKDLLMYFDLD